MWLFTTRGFYSIVQTKRDKPLMFRARAQKDIDALVALYDELYEPTEPLPVIETPDADYPFRVLLAHDRAQVIIARLVADIDYGNFKDAVRRRQGPAREEAYHGVWAVLRRTIDARFGGLKNAALDRPKRAAR